MKGSVKTIDLLREKLDNAKRRANALGVCTDRLAKVQAEDVIAQFLSIKPYWHLFADSDWSFFECHAELNYPDDYAMYAALSDENKTLCRQYIRFFLDCVIELEAFSVKDAGVP